MKSPELVHWSIRLGDDVDPLAIYAASTDPQRSFLSVRDGGAVFAAIGEAATIEVADSTRRSRFQAVARERFRLGTQLCPAEPNGLGPSPVLIGGFAFDPQHQPAPDSDWAEFPAAHLTLARILIRRTTTGAVWATVVTPRGDSGCTPSEAEAEINNLVDDARRWKAPDLGSEGARNQRAGNSSTTGDGEQDPTYDFLSETELNNTAYPTLVRHILSEIESTSLDKVVAARALDFPRAKDSGPTAVSSELTAGDLTWALNERFDNATVFAFTQSEHTFLGASPELLVRIDGNRVHTEAIAGSRPRGEDAAADAAIAHDMATDDKEQAEHRFVIENLRRNLTGAGVNVTEPAPTQVRKLPGIQHLFTPLSGATSATATTAIAMVGALHPSAAVCGTPSVDALRFLRTNEDLERGWYAGPVGWTDLDGHGEFFVALRSGVLGPDRLRLFAGAGIVEGSDPERELAETTMKFHAVLDPARDLSRSHEQLAAPASTIGGQP